MKKFISGLLVVLALLTSAWAHHSHGNYEMTTYIEMEGVVDDLLWINPHTWIYLNVNNENGENTLWALEGGSPSALARRGWARGDVNIGDNISIRCHQLKDKSNGCLLGFVTPENGEEKEWD